MILTKARSRQFSDRLQAVVLNAIEKSGLSARQVSLEVTGHDGLIRDIKNDRIPSADRLDALFEFLDIDMQLSPRLVHDEDTSKRDWRGFAEDQLTIEGRKEALALGYEPIPFLHEAGGAEDLSPIAFSRDWITERGLDHDQLRMAIVPDGQGMGPHANGDRLVIDVRRPVEIDGRIFAYFNSLMGGLQIAHLTRLPDAQIVAIRHMSDQIEQLVLKPGHKIIGPVVGSMSGFAGATK